MLYESRSVKLMQTSCALAILITYDVMFVHCFHCGITVYRIIWLSLILRHVGYKEETWQTSCVLVVLRCDFTITQPHNKKHRDLIHLTHDNGM